MANFNVFSNNLRRRGRWVEQNAAELVRRVAGAIDTAVVLATPVDTGRARANWQVSIGESAPDSREAFAPGKAGSTQGENSRAAIEEGQKVIDTYQGGSSIHVYNNLPYIGALNNGHSGQAPAGFVETAIQNGIAMVQGSGGTLTERPRGGN